MTASREQFVAACSAAAVFDVMSGAPSAAAGDGTAPKFETYISRKGGMVQYASETDLAGLIWWKARSDEPGNPQYEAANKKQSRYLAAWIAYRQAKPDEVWTGERNKVQVTAAPPSDSPQTYPREARQTQAAAAAPAGNNYDSEPMDDIPFIANVTSDAQERWNAPRRSY